MDAASYRERLYHVFVGKTDDVEPKIDQALHVGTEYLDLSVGFLTHIDQGVQEIVQAVGAHPLIQPGESCPLDQAYCRRTIERETPLAVQNATTSPAISETAVRTFELGTYIGAKVVVGDETYGTICFADQDDRDAGFTDAESHFVELLAHLAGKELERQGYERELDDREALLSEREEIYRALIDASFDLVFRIDTEGTFRFVSAPVEAMLGYPPEAYVGRPFTEMLPDEATVELATDIYERVLAGHTVEEEYFPLESRTGEHVVVDVRVTPLYQSDVPPEDRTAEDIVGVQGAARIATDRLRRERLNRVLNRVLRHNLRNDMNVIGGYADLLTERLSGEDASHAERISETSDRLLDLAESARKLEENLETEPALEAMDLVPVVERAVRQITERYPAADLTAETPSHAVVQSAPRLETAVWELVDNAAQHAGAQPDVSVTVTTTEEWVVVEIADNGPGLPDIERSVLATGEETPLVHGQGLGLWLVYWIIETVNGELHVRDTDVGTCVEIRLHAGDASAEPATE